MDIFLARACEGKPPSQGGLYLGEFREALAGRYPEHAQDIKTMKRKDLTQFCGNSSTISSDVRKAKSSYFKPNSPLTSDQERLCRCIAHVSGKEGSYNPYAICRASTGVGGQIKCAEYFDYDNMPPHEVEAYAKMKGKTVSQLKNS